MAMKNDVLKDAFIGETGRVIFWRIGAIIGILTITLRCGQVLVIRDEPPVIVIIRLLSFFTIIGNMGVTLYFVAKLLPFACRFKQFFSRAGTSTALASYITAICVIYHALLKDAWDPTGMVFVADRLLHLVIPLFYAIYWFTCVPKAPIQWKMAPRWLLLPFIYFLYVLLIGELMIAYPYPFFDVPTLGYSKVILMALELVSVIFLIALFYVGMSRLLSRKYRLRRLDEGM